MTRLLTDGFECSAAVAGCVFVFALVTAPLAWAGELAEPSSPVTAAEAWQVVADELRGRGFGEEQLPRVEDLELPVAVPARAGRRLRVSSVCWDADAGSARFRLECGEAGACLPFLVYVRAAARARAASCRLERQAQPSSSLSSSSSSLRHAPEPGVRAGERATAVLVAAGIRMTAEVTCLDRGARGDVIRVRGQEGRIFRARVAGLALVEAMPH